MSPVKMVPRIIQHAFATLMQGARLDSYAENEQQIRMQVQGLEIIGSELFQHTGKIMERVTGRHIPLQLSFSGVQHLKRADFFTVLDRLPLDDPSRIIAFMHSWVQPGMRDIFHMFGLRGEAKSDMNFFAGSVAFEQGEGGAPFIFERDYSPSPPMPAGEVPQPDDIHARFGGDPVLFRLDGKTIEHKLFIGGLESQPDTRPNVDAVLNLGEKPSVWVQDGELHPNDRTAEKGEGSNGISAEEIRAEADWVIERLKRNESVLVHCVAGMNRSTTICCAVLMQLEGLTAQQALERIYEHHPWAKPDSHHWLMLRWLQMNQKE